MHPEASARFLGEAKTAMRLRCENVARVLDVGTLNGGDPYIAIELLEGCDLGKRIEDRGPLPTEEAVDLTLQACHALAEAHAAGVIHRDIKPANLFLTRDAAGRRVVKLLDFGISKLRDDAAEITKTAAVMGSVPYMSPEPLESSRRVDERSDIYSLGVTLYELLTGLLPFEGETMPQVCASIIKGRATDILARLPSLPKDLASVVRRAFASDPQERPETVVAFAASLLPFASGAGRAYAQRISGIGVDSPPSVPPAAPAPRQVRAAALDETLAAPSSLEQVAAAVSGPRPPNDTDISITAPSRKALANRDIWIAGAAVAAVLGVAAVLLTRGVDAPPTGSPARGEIEPTKSTPTAGSIDVAPSAPSASSSAGGTSSSSTASATASSQPGAARRPVLPPTTATATTPSLPTAKPSTGVWGRN